MFCLSFFTNVLAIHPKIIGHFRVLFFQNGTKGENFDTAISSFNVNEVTIHGEDFSLRLTLKYGLK